ncbi:MAG: hypothetical protein RIT81_06075 [Deltaproteobacteria bacterium]
MRRVGWLLGGLVVVGNGAVAEAATVSLGRIDAATPTKVRLAAYALHDDTLAIQVTGGGAKTIEIYPPTLSTVERAEKSCRLQLTGGSVTLSRSSAPDSCASLFGVSSTKTFAVSFENSARYVLLELTVPAKHSNAEAKIEIERKKGDAELHLEKWVVPQAIQLSGGDQTVYYFTSRWRSARLDGRTIAADSLDVAALKSFLAPGGRSTLPIYVEAFEPTDVGDARYLRFDLTMTLEPEPKDPPKDPPPFSDLCRVAADQDESVGTDWYYVVCVDLRSDEQAVITRARAGNCPPLPEPVQGQPAPKSDCEPHEPADDALERSGNHFFVNRRIVVHAWFPPKSFDHRAQFDSYGFTSNVYVHENFGFAQDTAESAPAVATFKRARFERDPLTHGTRRLTVSYKVKDGSNTKTVELEKRYQVERLYKSAWRVGFSMSWAPWMRTYDVVPRENGSVIAAVDGDGSVPGVGGFELMVGYSWYGEERGELDDSWDCGFYLGFGVLEIGRETKFISSIMAGPELMKGHNYSLVLALGLRRYDRLPSRYREDQSVPTGTNLATYPWLSPAASLILNFSPDFLLAATAVKNKYGETQ